MYLSFERKLWLGFIASSVAALVIVLAALFACRAVLDARDAQSAIHAQNLALIERLRAHVTKFVGTTHGYLATNDPQLLAQIAEQHRAFAEDHALFAAQMSDPSERALVERITALDEELTKAHDAALQLQRAGGSRAEVDEHLLTYAGPLRRRLEEALLELARAERTHLLAAGAHASDAAARSLWLIVGLTAVSLLVTAAFGTMLVRTFTRLYRESQAAVRARDEFLSVASHELRSPLNTLRLHTQGLARLLRNGATPTREQLSPRLSSADRQVERLVRLVEQLLDVSRLSAGPLVLEREAFDLVPLVRDVVARCEEELGRAGCVLDVELPDRLQGSWDRAKVDQVLTNLLSNAAKYGRGKPVHLRLVCDQGRAQLLVRDEGIGVAPEDQARIFQRFERVGGREIPGFGLGLWICREIVAAHGGTIRVESRLGEGSAFTVELPGAEAGLRPAELAG